MEALSNYFLILFAITLKKQQTLKYLKILISQSKNVH